MNEFNPKNPNNTNKMSPEEGEKVKSIFGKIIDIIVILTQYYVKNLKTLWHTATYVYNSPLRCTLQHLADDIENS